MSIFDDAKEQGGSQTQTQQSTHVVSLWNVPGGSDYCNAQEVKFHFDDHEPAEKFAQMYRNPPELAIAYLRSGEETFV
jgi:hypothetical protein